jgi:hypothetical protein
MNKITEADFFPQAVDGSSVDKKCTTRFQAVLTPKREEKPALAWY